MQDTQAILTFLVVIVLVCLAAGAADALQDAMTRPRIRPAMLLRMYRLARQNYGVCASYRLARLFELATRPEGDL